MSRSLRVALAVVPFVLIVACTDAAKAPAEAAMAAAGSAVESLQGKAEKYAPDAVKAAQASLSSARDRLAKQDYKGALSAAEEVSGKVKMALAAAAARKDELTKACVDMAGAASQAIADLKARIATLSAAKKLPKGMDRAVLDKANEGLAAIESGWKKVTRQVKDGEYTDAIVGSKELKAQAEDILRSLGGN